MSKSKKASNLNRAGVVPAWPGCRTEWWVVLSIDPEDVADNKGSVTDVFPTKRGAAGCAEKINDAIREASRVAWEAGRAGKKEPK